MALVRPETEMAPVRSCLRVHIRGCRVVRAPRLGAVHLSVPAPALGFLLDLDEAVLGCVRGRAREWFARGTPAEVVEESYRHSCVTWRLSEDEAAALSEPPRSVVVLARLHVQPDPPARQHRGKGQSPRRDGAHDRMVPREGQARRERGRPAGRQGPVRPVRPGPGLPAGRGRAGRRPHRVRDGPLRRRPAPAGGRTCAGSRRDDVQDAADAVPRRAAPGPGPAHTPKSDILGTTMWCRQTGHGKNLFNGRCHVLTRPKQTYWEPQCGADRLGLGTARTCSTAVA